MPGSKLKVDAMFVPQKLYGVIGDPISHSLSPVLHNTGFQAWGIPAVLMAWHITPSALPDFVRAMRLLPIAGACVTIPHKEAIIPLLDRVTGLARRVGAVNTVYWEDGELVGHNTDVEGFLFPLYHRSAPTTVLILGAGGAARAVLSGLLTLPGVQRIAITARREEQVQALLAAVQPAENDDHDHDEALEPASLAARRLPQVEYLPWTRREEFPADLIVNTTPLGMDSGAEPGSSPLRVFHGLGLAYDIIYQDTPFLAAARAAGWETQNGRDMFVNQGSAQFILWTGFPLPEAATAALDAALDRRHDYS